MQITVFTSNQPRHISLIEELAKVADKVYAFIETNTLFPGQVEDFYKKTDVMQQYFSNVVNAEKEIFGTPRFLPSNVQCLPMKMHDLNRLDTSIFNQVKDSDYFVVFGATYIKGELIDLLVEKKALNIHMGISPHYRGSSCNFWACYDKNYDKVGATIHMLSKGLDSGDMLMHCFPSFKENPFEYTMQATKAAHMALVDLIQNNKKHLPIKQDKSIQIRYTKNADFTDEVASHFLQNLPKTDDVLNSIRQRNLNDYYNPFVF